MYGLDGEAGVTISEKRKYTKEQIFIDSVDPFWTGPMSGLVVVVVVVVVIRFCFLCVCVFPNRFFCVFLFFVCESLDRDSLVKWVLNS